MKADYCPISNEPCQSMCDTPCSTQERVCKTCIHFKQGTSPKVGVYDIDCFECKHYYASKWEQRK